MSLPASKIAEYREAFGVFDRDGNGEISTSELKGAMAALGQNLNDAQVRRLLHSVDANCM
jgi:calmodulin